MIYDCHLHIEFPGDSSAPTSPQIEGAIELGMKEMCITDHHDYDSGFCNCNFILDIPICLTSLRMFQAEYRNRTHINIRIELELQDRLKEYLSHSVKHYGDFFDFIIGSSHFTKSMDPYDPEYWNKRGEIPGFEDFPEAFLVHVKNLCHIFDSFGRLDCTVRYAPHQNDLYNYRHLGQWIDPFLKTFIENGKSLECNTGDFKYDLGQPNPCREIFMRYRGLGDEVMATGSDAHTPEYVGYAFNTYHELLSDCGYRHPTVYHGRKPEFILLQPGVSVCI